MHIYRQILYPGAWTYVWSRDGNLNPDGWIMVGPGGRFQPTQISLGLRALSYYDSAYHHALRIPAPIPTGTYDLEMDQQYTGLGLIIEDVPDTSTPYPVQPSVTSDPVDDIQTAPKPWQRPLGTRKLHLDAHDRRPRQSNHPGLWGDARPDVRECHRSGGLSV
jgi:hypothetical protein